MEAKENRVDDEQAKRRKKSRRKRAISNVVMVVLIVFVVAVGIALFFILNNNTTTNKTENEDVAETSLSCRTTSLSEGAAIIDFYGAVAMEYRIEAIFHDDSLYNMSMYVVATYDSAATAEEANPYVQADLNYYIADQGLRTDYYLYETWGVVDNQLNLTMNVTEDKYNTASAPVFLIDNVEKTDETKTVPTSRAAIKNNYQKKGFSCTTND